MAGRLSPPALLLIGAGLATFALGVDWIRMDGFVAPGRVLDARLFIVATVALAALAAHQARRGDRAAVRLATAAAISMTAGFAVAIRQLGLSTISPTALAVVAATVAALLLARQQLVASAA